ncbi:MAG: dipeptidase [Pseudomonadota bacterium]
MDSMHSRVRDALSGTLVWDNHGCMPLRPDDERFLPQLERYRRSGMKIVGLNVAFDAVPWEQTFRMLATFRHWLRRHPKQYRLVETVADLARPDRRLAVFFDIEGTSALNGQLSLVELYRDLGVRWMSMASNRNNLVGGGCQDADKGLTKFGRAVVTEMERVGMTACCSHTGHRTTMDVMRHATKPVIFSHSNPLALWKHKRNIRDEAIRACAETGGVVGVNGIGMFLGANDNRSATVARHVDYVVQLVGIDHVGIGLDYVFDMQELDDYIKAHPETFPPEEGYAAGLRIVAPEQLPEIAAELLKLGYRVSDVRKVLGGNFLRVAKATWPKRLPARG